MKVRSNGIAQYTTVVSVTCVPRVEISNFTAGTRTGAGPMSGAFEVAPASALCRAANAGGIAGRPSVGVTDVSRTVSVSTTATGWLDIEVECEAVGHAAAAATARFTAHDDAVCTTGLGTVGHSTRVHPGSIAQDTRCVSAQRSATGSAATFYAHRHTLRLAAAGWVTVNLAGTGTGAARLDPYLLILNGHGSGGTVRGRDNNNGTGTDARLAGVLLAAGAYTVEATTATAGAAGAYRLTVGVDHNIRAPDQPARTIAAVGQAKTITWAHQPATATVAIQSVTPSGLDTAIRTDDGRATLVATPTHAGDYTVTVAYTAAGHTSTKTTVIDADCPPRHIQTQTRTCTPQATTLPTACTAVQLHNGRLWGRKSRSASFASYGSTAPAACSSLSQNGRALYLSFSMPRRLPVRFDLGAKKPANPPNLLAHVSEAAYLHLGGGAPTMTLWRERSAIGTSDTTLAFVAVSPSILNAAPSLELTSTSGTYIIEVAPTGSVTANGQLRLQTDMPTKERTLADVQYVGNTGLDGGGMTLGQFLDARGSIIYGAHPDADPARVSDAFYPSSPNYPWLPFTADQCSIPLNTIPVIAQVLQFYNFEDYPNFGGTTVPFIYGCMRHDFNWRNLYRIEHDLGYVDGHSDGFWRRNTMREANGRLVEDLYFLCSVDATPAIPHPDSPHFNWRVPRTMGTEQIFVNRCNRKADQIKWAVGLADLQFSSINHVTE